MRSPTLELLIARRETVSRDMAALDQVRAELEAEDHELLVTERVLIRLNPSAFNQSQVLPRASNDEREPWPPANNAEPIRRLTAERSVRPAEPHSPPLTYFTRGEPAEGNGSIASLSLQLARALVRQPAKLGVLFKLTD